MPKRVPSEHKRSQQLLVRLTESELEVLEAASHLHHMTTSAYTYELLRAHLSALSSDEFVQRDLANRAAFDQAQGSLTKLSESRPPRSSLPQSSSSAVDRA